jgi:hypothetical protein
MSASQVIQVIAVDPVKKTSGYGLQATG